MKKKLIASCITAFIMAMIMSLVQALCNVGFSDQLIPVWFRAWRISCVVAIPLSYFLPSRVAAFVNRHFS